MNETAESSKSLLNNMADPVLVLDAEMGFLFGNAKLNTLSGYAPSELTGAGASKIFNIGTLERITSVCWLYRQGERCTTCFESSLVSKNHSEIPVELNVSYTEWNGNMAAVAVARQLSHRKVVEENMREVMNEQSRKISNLHEVLKNKDGNIEEYEHAREVLSTQLLETNRAIGVLAKNAENAQKEISRIMAGKINSRIMPIVAGIKEKRNISKTDIEVLERYLNELVSGGDSGCDIFAGLSLSEMKIASLIARGATSDEISRELGISLNTLKTHRKNMRKKLKLQNSKINLAAYLQSKMN